METSSAATRTPCTRAAGSDDGSDSDEWSLAGYVALPSSFSRRSLRLVEEARQQTEEARQQTEDARQHAKDARQQAEDARQQAEDARQKQFEDARRLRKTDEELDKTRSELIKAREEVRKLQDGDIIPSSLIAWRKRMIAGLKKGYMRGQLAVETSTIEEGDSALHLDHFHPPVTEKEQKWTCRLLGSLHTDAIEAVVHGNAVALEGARNHPPDQVDLALPVEDIDEPGAWVAPDMKRDDALVYVDLYVDQRSNKPPIAADYNAIVELVDQYAERLMAFDMDDIEESIAASVDVLTSKAAQLKAMDSDHEFTMRVANSMEVACRDLKVAKNKAFH